MPWDREGDFVNTKYAYVCHAELNAILNNKGSVLENAGIAYVNNYVDPGTACDLAVDCCDNAKKRAKLKSNLINGEPGNWIDFQLYFDDNFNDVDMLRNNSKSMDGAYDLTLRPYVLDLQFKNHPCYYKNFEKLLNIVLNDKSLEISREEILYAIKQGKYDFDILKRIVLSNGKLNKKIFSDSLVKAPDDGNYVNTLYDVFEYCGVYV